MHRVFAVPVALMFAGAAAVTPSAQERIAAFDKKAHELREKKHLKVDAVYRQYPTPEVTLAGKAPLVLTPGSSGTIKAAVKRVPKDALVIVDCDQVETIAVKNNGKAIEAKVKAKAAWFTKPVTCGLMTMLPLSTARVSLPSAIEVRGKTTWKLQLSNGMKLEIGELSETMYLRARSKWQFPDGSSDERDITFGGELRAPGPISIEVSNSEADIAAYNVEWQADPLHAEADKVRMEKRKVETEQGAAAAQQQFSAREKPIEARRVEILAKNTRACRYLSVEVAADGKIKGTAAGCPGGDANVTVTGTLVNNPG